MLPEGSKQNRHVPFVRSTRESEPLGMIFLNHGRGATQYRVTNKTTKSDTMLQARLVTSTVLGTAVNVGTVPAVRNRRTSTKHTPRG